MITSWKDVTIEKYQEICDVVSEGIEKNIDLISILTEKDSEEIRQMPLPEVFAMVEDMKFLSTPPNADVIKRFTLDGVEYGLIPDFNFIKYGVWLDGDTWKDKAIENMHLYAALLFRPIKESRAEDDYDILPHSPNGFTYRSNLFREKLSVEKIYGAQLFFSLFALEYLETLPTYLERQTNQKTKAKKTSKKKTAQQATKKRKQKPSTGHSGGTT